MENDETQWIERARKDPRHFTPLYERYHTPIFLYLVKRAGDRELANDLTQQTFLKAMLALLRYRSIGIPFKAWLYRIAMNELRMFWRKRKPIVMDLSYVEVRDLASEVGVIEEEEPMQQLAQALSRLDEARARLIELRFMEGLSFAEVGQVLGIGEDAAKMRTHRALGVLRKHMKPAP